MIESSPQCASKFFASRYCRANLTRYRRAIKQAFLASVEESRRPPPDDLAVEEEVEEVEMVRHNHTDSAIQPNTLIAG